VIEVDWGPGVCADDVGAVGIEGHLVGVLLLLLSCADVLQGVLHVAFCPGLQPGHCSCAGYCCLLLLNSSDQLECQLSVIMARSTEDESIPVQLMARLITAHVVLTLTGL